MANANGWGDGASNNNIGWGKGADNAIGWGSVYSVSSAGLTDIVGTPAVDPDAQAFITAASITDPTQQSAINDLVVDLKGYGVWSKMKALYPFVGGTAAQHKWNLKDPRDLDAAFRLVFNGGWTHSSTGALPNGVNAFADTKFTPSLSLSANSAHLSYYSRTASTSSSNNYVFAANNPTGFNALILRDSLKLFRFTNTSTAFEDAQNTTALATSGLFLGSQDSSNIKLFRNGSNIGQNSATASGGLVNIPMFIGATNDLGSANAFTTTQCAFASIGSGLTDTEAANFYTAVQAFQVTLNRQIP